MCHAGLADSMGVYTARDYAECLRHLMKRWHIHSIEVRPVRSAARTLTSLAHLLYAAACPAWRSSRQLAARPLTFSDVLSALQLESPEARQAQEYLGGHEERMFRMAAVHEERCDRQRCKGSRPAFPCNWVHGTTVQIK
jgi:Fatty acid desaturase